MPNPLAQVNLHVHDVSKEFEYFTGVLGFHPEFRVRDPGRGGHVFAGCTFGRGATRFAVILGGIEEALEGHYDHGAFGHQMEEHPLGTGVVLHFTVPSVDKKYAEITKKGAIIDEPPTDQFWGERTISVTTPAGFYVTFAQPIKGFRFPDGFTERTEVFPGATLMRPPRASKKKARARRSKRASR